MEEGNDGSEESSDQCRCDQSWESVVGGGSARPFRLSIGSAAAAEDCSVVRVALSGEEADDDAHDEEALPPPDRGLVRA